MPVDMSVRLDSSSPQPRLRSPTHFPRLNEGLKIQIRLENRNRKKTESDPGSCGSFVHERPGCFDPKGLIGWIAYWRNPIWCFALFFAYLATLPVLGSLIGGVLFVFTLMGALGGWSPRNLVQHSALALISVGGMWGIFTYGLGVILPPGEIFSPF